MLWLLRLFPQFNRLADDLALAREAQSNAAEQLIAERALRQAAEERADRYHGELIEALKQNTDWFARGFYHRKPMFGAPDAPSESKSAEIPSKPTARREAQKITNETLRDVLSRIRAEEEAPVGPEFTTQ
jgi:hypothetical protein